MNKQSTLTKKVNTMQIKIIRCKDYDEMSKKAAEKIISSIEKKPNIVLGLATGSTPIGLYKELIQDHKLHGTSYKHVHTVNLDEYVGLAPEDKNSYFSFMKKQLFDKIDINLTHTNIPNGIAPDLEEESKRYNQLIESLGGVDLQILGIGQNGHIGFNEPGTPFTSTTHTIQLTESTRTANASHFNSLDEVPTYAITMGVQNIMSSKEILLLASGSSKAKALQQLINGEVTEELPASVLRLHDNVTIIADEEALKYI